MMLCPAVIVSQPYSSFINAEFSLFPNQLDDSLVARELAITDSEHSDVEVSYTDNGTFNLSRGQTPLTEGSEDLDRHSDPEESFARDLPDFPSINPDATLLDDEDDTSIGIPSVPYRSLTQEEARLYSDQEEINTELSLSGLLPANDFTSDIAGIIASNMIQAALAGAVQGPPRRDNPQRAPPRGYRKQSSSELDTDVEGDDFEMLDQSELSQIDPTGSQSREGGQQQQYSASGFISNLLRKQ
ncbi:reticulophagy regulator 3-like [Polyodon spathula]|uniref:reticulophagy regulator 3-like n=1 Tax=Polyodon spathula TaxID=7913 RepID=UPI001B7E6ACC|nr:reticulophagy regulator 3-like [Polyodon spathula]